MKKLQLSCVCLMAFVQFSQGQIDSFDISTFARPELFRKTLQVDGSASLSNRNSKSGPSLRSTNLDLRLSGGVSTTNFKNTLDKQSTQSFSGDLSLFFDLNDTNQSGNEKGFVVNPRLNYFTSTKHFSSEKKFVELELLELFTYNFSRSSDDIETAKRGVLYSNTSIGLYKGKGRIEFVTDAWHAHTIVEMLEKRGLLQAETISKEQIHALANRISEIKNRRFTDFRFYRINEYEELVEHLATNGMVNLEDYSFFAHLHDIWSYERFVSRRHGKEFKYGLSSVMFARYDSDQDEVDLDPSVQLELIYNKYNAKSTDWQVDQNHMIFFGSRWYDLFADNPIPEEQIYVAGINSSVSIGFFPSQRTNYRLNVSAEYNQYFSDIVSSNLYFQAGFEYNFYVSPQLNWRLNSGISLFTVGDRIFDNNYTNNNFVNFSSYYDIY